MSADTLTLYRDDGPLAGVLGRAAARIPAAALAGLAAVVLVAAIAIEGDDATDGLAAGVLAGVVLLGGLSRAGTERGRFRWAVPPLIRLTEYTGLLWIGALGDALPAAFALVAALSFRHYDLVYRLRHRGMAPPRWVDLAGLGWEGRLVLGCVLLVAGALPVGFYVLAGLLGVLYVAESVAGWTGGTRQQTAVYEDEEDEGQ